MNNLTAKERRDGWPEWIRLPSPNHFVRGVWTHDRECGSVGCLVGNVMISFMGKKALDYSWGGCWNTPIPRAAKEFLRTICRLEGHPVPPYVDEVLHASYLFEDVSGSGRTVRGMTFERATELFRMAASEHGYDVDHAVPMKKDEII
jgi:hypothetical protein